MTNKKQTQKEKIKDLDERITVLEDRPYYPPSMVDNLGKAPTQEDLDCRCGDKDYSAKPLCIPTMMTDTSCQPRKVIGEFWGYPVYADDDDPEVSLNPNDEDEPFVDNELEKGDMVEYGSVSKMDALLTDCLEYQIFGINENSDEILMELKANKSYIAEYKRIIENQIWEKMYVYNQDKEIYIEGVCRETVIGNYDKNCFMACIRFDAIKQY